MAAQPHALAESHIEATIAQDARLGQVREQIQETQQSLHNLEARKDSIVAQLASIEQQYGRLAKTLGELKQKAAESSARLAQVEQQQRTLRSNILRQNRSLEGQIRAVYAAGRQEWLKLVLNQENANRLSRMLTYHGYFSRARLSQLQTLRDDLNRSRQLENELTSAVQGLAQTRSQLEEEQGRLDTSRRERKRLMAQLALEFQDQNLQLKALQDDERRLHGVVVSLQPAATGVRLEPRSDVPTAPASKGQRRWPVVGPIRAGFGTPRMGGKWDGVLISVPEGTPVRAVSAGSVAFADWLRGYGLLTILDHGNGYMSLYAFNQSLLRNVGDRVEAGDIIASAGASGGQSQAGLYFGVREHGRPIDPVAWCSRAP